MKINYAYSDGADVINKLTTSTPPSTTSRTSRSSSEKAQLAGTPALEPTEEDRDATASLEREARAPVRAHHGEREKQGRSTKRAKEIAARTVNKERARKGEARQSSRSSTRDLSSGRRGGLRSGTSRPRGRTKEQLYNEAKRLNIKGRSSMNKQQLQQRSTEE